jgi:signal peptidase II
VTSGRVLFAAVAVFVVAVDRLTKHAVETGIPINTEVAAVDHVLWFQHVENSCAAFSTCLASNGVFLVISIVVAAAIVIYAWTHAGGLGVNAVLGLILGGTLGNGYDRLFHGQVTDFIALHWWPTFNVADSAIVVGVLLLATSYLFRPRAAT